MHTRKLATASTCAVLVGVCLLSTTPAVIPAEAATSVAKGDPLGALSDAERERFLAANANGSMTIDWTPTPYDLALENVIATQKAGVISELPTPLDFPLVEKDQLSAPALSAIAPVPHTPTVTSAVSRTTGAATAATAAYYQSDHVSYSNLGAVVRIDYALLLNPPTPTTGDCSGSSYNCFWFNAADGRNADNYYLHWGVQHGGSANGTSGSGWKLVLSGYSPTGGFFGGITTAGGATVTTGTWHVISLRMVETAQLPGWLSHWKIYLDNTETGDVWIGGLFLDLDTSFWQEIYETDGPCTTARGASLFDNVTYHRLFDPVTYSVNAGTVSYEATCSNTNFQPGYGAAVDLRQTPRTVSNGTTIAF